MTTALVLATGGVIILGLVLLARWLDMAAWGTSLVAYQLHLPASLDVEQVAAWLANVHALTHPGRFSLFSVSPICLEVVSTMRGIGFYVLVSRPAANKLLSGLRATLPGCRVSEAPDYPSLRPAWRLAAELTMTSRDRPLAIERAEQTSTSLLAALQPLTGDGTEIRLQYILTSAGTARPVPTAHSSDNLGAAWSWEQTPSRDAEAVQAARVKRRDPPLSMVVRVGVAAQNRVQARALFGRVWNNYHTLNNVGVRLRRRWLPSGVVANRLTKRRYPVTNWPLLLGSKEAAGLLSLPVSATPLIGVAVGIARQLPPPLSMPSHGMLLGVSNYTGMEQRSIALKTEDRLMHHSILGPTGSGKSWLLANMILQDIAAGRGTLVVDPKGDLLKDVASRILDKDTDRVVVLDASQRDYPIGLNILGGGRDEESRERTVDNVLHIFRSIWADSWGPAFRCPVPSSAQHPGIHSWCRWLSAHLV
jgi:Helicase HerA, central domain